MNGWDGKETDLAGINWEGLRKGEDKNDFSVFGFGYRVDGWACLDMESRKSCHFQNGKYEREEMTSQVWCSSL